MLQEKNTVLKCYLEQTVNTSVRVREHTFICVSVLPCCYETYLLNITLKGETLFLVNFTGYNGIV